MIITLTRWFTTRPRRPAATNQRCGARVLRSKSAERSRRGPRILGAALCEIGVKREENIMITKGSIFISCLAVGALIASPALGKPEKKSTGASTSKPKHTSPQTTQVTPSRRYQQNRQRVSSRMGNTRYYAGTRYSGTRNYAGPQSRGTIYYGRNGYYGGTRAYYGNNAYYGGTGYYGGGSAYPYYSYSSGWPYSNWGYGTSWGYYPYSYGGGYPYSYNNNYYSYYTPTYGYNASLVVAVQQRLGQLGYYHGVVDGVAGPRTSSAIAAFESRHGLIVDGRISRPLLNRLGLA
jgi:Putative peptidoglycan binding domain